MNHLFSWARILVVAGLCLGLAGRADTPSPEKEKEEKKEEKKKDDEDKTPLAQVDPKFIQDFTVTLSSTVGALIALQTIPGSVRTSWSAISEMWHFKEHNKEQKRLKQELDAFLAKKDEKLKELGQAIGRYRPALDELDAHVKTVLNGESPSLETRYGQIESDLQTLLEMPGAARWKTELTEALAAWRADHRDYPIEQWIKGRLRTKFLTTGEGAAWLKAYLRHQKELAAAFWLERGSAVLIDQFYANNEKREAVLDEPEKNWQSRFSKLRKDEEAAARTFVREFATFTRELNSDLEDPGHKFSEILAWANREPGVFHTSDSGSPVPIAAAKMASYAEARCTAGMKVLSGAYRAAWQKGTVWMLPWQGLKAAAPLATSSATAATSYMAVRGLIRLSSQFWSPQP
jgi:hypothetical protein